MTLEQIRQLWYRIWFTPTSPAPLCLFRIFFGLLVFCSTLQLLPDLMTWFGPKGIATVQTIQQFENSNRLSLLFIAPESETFIYILHGILLLSTFCLCIGFRTNLSSLITFICMVSFHHRNPLIFNSGDTIMRLCTFLFIFSPAGKMYSIDSWLAKRSGEPPSSEEIKCTPWVQYLIRFQIAAVYWHSFFGKMNGETWRNGTAVYYATRMEDFHKLSLPILFDNLWIIQVLTYGTLATECALWSLIWIKEFRYYVLVAGVLLHLGIEWSMNLPFFELLMIASYIVFVEPSDVERVVQWVKRKVVPTSATESNFDKDNSTSTASS